MKKLIFLVLVIVALVSCNRQQKRSDAKLEDPAKVQPPADAVPDSTRILNDSVIVPSKQGK